MKTRSLFGFLTQGLLLVVFAVSTPVAYPRQNAPSGLGAIGSFKVGPYGRFNYKAGKKGITFFLTGKNGGVVQATSNLYDVAAKRLDLATTSVGGKNKPTDMTATGSVKIVIRDAESARKTVVTCDKAVFVAGTDPAQRGTLRLTGDVVSDTWDKSLVAPLHSESETGKIVFLPDNEIDVILENGTFRGQPIEPPAKPKGKKP